MIVSRHRHDVPTVGTHDLECMFVFKVKLESYLPPKNCMTDDRYGTGMAR